MLLYRSIGEKELRNLFEEDGKIFGQYNCKIESQNSHNSSATCCFFVDEILWKDVNHRFMIVVDIPEDCLTFGTGTYFAAKSLAKTKIWSGRDGSEIYKLREAYINSYKISQVKEVYLFDYFANHFIDRSLKPICDKYGIKLFVKEMPFANSKQKLVKDGYCYKTNDAINCTNATKFDEKKFIKETIDMLKKKKISVEQAKSIRCILLE